MCLEVFPSIEETQPFPGLRMQFSRAVAHEEKYTPQEGGGMIATMVKFYYLLCVPYLKRNL